MAKLEIFVRQVEETVAPRRVPSEPVAAAGPVILKFGVGNAIKTATGSYSATTTYYMDGNRTEPPKKDSLSLREDDAPPTIYDTDRQTHVKRFYWRDPKTDVKDDSVWVDVQRIDRIELILAPDHQSYFFYPKWYDSNDRSIENAAHDTVQILNPDDNDQFVEVTAMRTTDWDVSPYLPAEQFAKEDINGPEEDHINVNDRWWQGQVERLYLLLPDDAEAKGRKTLRIEDIRRVIHRDVKAEPDEDGLFDEGAYQLVSDDDAGDTHKDDGQYVNFAFPLKVTLRDSPQRLYQINYINLKQNYLLRFFEPMDPKDVDDDKKKQTWLDPFQNIINVQWGGLAVVFGDKAGAPPKPAD